MKRVTARFCKIFACRRCDRNIGKAVEQKDVCDEMGTVKVNMFKLHGESRWRM